MSEKVQVEIQADEDRDQSDEENKTTEDRQGGEGEVQHKPEAENKAKDGSADLLKAAENKAEEYYDRLLRASAEFDNYKKRTTREMRDVVRYANEKLFNELLFVIDNLERAIESAQQASSSDGPLLEGIRLTLNEVEKILERNNVKPIKSLGEAFDPNFHQAMMQEETEDQPANIVVKEMQKGYLLHDRLLRPAMVVVSKAKNKEN